ncbi:MAG: 6-phosphogluconolactonase [Zetaproteobacteria bacterium]|nr:6-phosphogluconolactonase [Zetaproteobacteria bacterium]
MTAHGNSDLLADAIVDRFVTMATQAIEARGRFHVALAGGTTPKVCYQRLRHADLDWSNIHLWFGDERCLPIGDPERNDTMAKDALIEHIDIPKENIHPMAAERGAIFAAENYAHQLIEQGVTFDLVLLGMGEDGHTASLFPNNPALLEKEQVVVAVFNAPKPPPERVSLGYASINHARHRMIIVTGDGKRAVFERICKGELFPISIPASEWHYAF